MTEFRHRSTPPLHRGRLGATLLAAALLTSSCIHTFERRQGQTREQKLDLYTTTATYLYEDGSLDRAEDQAVKALKLDPDNRPMRRMVGMIKLRKGRNEDLILAERFFRDLARDGDANPTTRLGLAIACERLGTSYDKVSQAIAAGAREPQAAGREAVEASDLAGKARRYWAEAATILEGMVETGEGSTDVMNAMQRLCALRGDYDESIRWSQRLLERSQGELDFWRGKLTSEKLTESEERLFRTNEAKARSLQTDTHLFLTTVLFSLSRHEEALEHIDAVLTETPELAQGYSIRAQIRHQLGRFAGAAEDLNRYLMLSNAPFEDPDVRRAFDLLRTCERELQQASRGL